MVRLVAAAVALAVGTGCGGRDDLDGRRAPVRGLPERTPAYELPIAQGRVAVYDLYDNRASASIHIEEALHIDCGSPDFAKYAEGGYRSPWHLGRRDGGVRAALVDGLAAELYFPLDRATGGVYRAGDGGIRIAFYARAAEEGQLVSVFLNEHRLRDVSMPGTEWSWYGVEAPASALVDGENKLRFYFKRTGELDGVRTAAAFARIAIGGRRPVPGRELTWPVRGQRVELADGALAAVSASVSSRVSYYIALPTARPALAFAAAGAGQASVYLDGERVWAGKGGASWAPVEVDLSARAGRIARIDLVSEGAVHWGRPRVIADLGATDGARADAPLADHVIVWTVSSLRADRLASAASELPTMAALAAEGATLRGYVAAAPEPSAAHETMLTGRYPVGDPLAEGAVTLGSRFRAAGFATALVSGNGFVNDERGYAQGFDRYSNPMRHRRPHSARVLWQEARKLLAKQKGGRSFVYIATVEPHLPYTPSEGAREAEWGGPPIRFDPAHTAELSAAVRSGTQTLTADERAWVAALYGGELRDADAALATMREDLGKLGLADSTAIVLVGDHGEELFERGNFGHGDTLYNEVLATPLVIWFPAAIRPRVVEAVVDAVDLYPTILDLAGIGANPEAQGASLLPLDGISGGPAFSHLPGRGRAVTFGRYRFIVPRAGRHELYDRSTDPGERDNLMGSLPVVERYARNLFGIRVAYEAAWQRRRWGTAANLSAAFASDHAM